jgi:hypothetical protein
MKDVNAMWQQVVRQIADSVYATVNTEETVGTNYETGYVLMFFNAKNHDGKSTLVTSETDINKLKKLFKAALKEAGGAKGQFFDQETMQ